MELEKTGIHISRAIGKASSQITLEDSCIVPDYKADVGKAIRQKGRVQIDEAVAANGAIWVKGSLIFEVLYRCDGQSGKISCIKGELPFQEKLNIDGLCDGDNIDAAGEAEDITVSVVNPRKINVRAILLLTASADREMDEELTTDVADGGSIEKKRGNLILSELGLCRKDICRQRLELVLPTSKPNVSEILWKSVDLRNVSGSVRDEECILAGEIQVCVLYSEEDGGRLQWYEATSPLDCRVECPDKVPDGIYSVKARPASFELEVKPDYDGEERIFVLEMAIELRVMIWHEENKEVLCDLYAVDRKLAPDFREINLERILIKNCAICRLTGQMELLHDKERLLQICACEGRAVIEKTESAAGGIKVCGIVIAELMYITTDDDMPIGTAKEIYPFEQWIEVPGAGENTRCDISGGLEQMSAVMLDQEHAQIKSAVRIELIAFENYVTENIESVTEAETDTDEASEGPGIVGYIVKRGDDLWEVAKQNNTTEADIMEINGRSDRRLEIGEKLLILRHPANK